MPGNSANDFDRGRRIGKYEILTRLSVGGMAELFLAFLPGPGGFKKFVAVKQILPDVKADDTFVRMFLDEARITAAFNHANIGQVFDLGEDSSSHELYLAMEFIAGQNLEQIVRRAGKLGVAIPPGFAARVVHDACLGLHYAHSFRDPTGQPMAVVHRDVSPKNVMVTYTGQVKMIDFGIAKARGRLNRTQVGIVRGTSGYMSPEQVRNEPLDGRTDLFAAGVMLHELLCGERLFTAPTDAAMMIRIAEEPAPDPSTVNPAVSAPLAQVVLKMLEKEPRQRFASGRDVARAIEQSCETLFEEEQVAEFMAQLFDDKIKITRSLLELANAGQDVSMKEAVKGLTLQEEEREKNTPNRPSPRPSASPSSQRLPKVTGPRRRPTKSRGMPRVTPPPPPPSDETEPPPTSSKRPSSASKLKAVAPEPGVTLSDAMPPEPPAKHLGLAGPLAILGVLVVLAIIGWAAAFGPLKDHTQELLAAHAEQPAAEATPIEPAQKPAWLVQKEQAAARVVQPTVEPERVRKTEELQQPGARATQGEVGYLTLRSINPNSSAVSLEDGTQLGSTPLVKIPLEVGTHRLHVVDGDAKVRLLSVSIEAGRELKLSAVDIGALPSAQ